jgi:lysophospholipase L1-like esterase
MNLKFTNVYLLDCYNWGIELHSDGVHPTKNGYDVIAERVAEYIRNKMF